MNPPRPRRVLMTADTVGGVWAFSIELCRALAPVHVTLMTMGGEPSARQFAEADALANVDLVPTDFRLEWMTDCRDDLERSGDALLRLSQDLRPDVVHVNGYWHAALPFEAPVLVTAHSCVPSWWRACRRIPLPAEWRDYAGWVRRAIEAADMLTAPTRAFLDEFECLHGRARRSRAIWNGRSATQFRSGIKRRLVLAAGRLWDDAKNIALVCEAAKGLDIPVAVMGELVAPDGAVFEPRGVAALGNVDTHEAARWMADASVFVAPARYEPFGLAILEAALSGCALVLGDIPSLRELWEGVAIFVSPDDAAGLRRAIRILTDTPGLAAEEGRKARERALTYSSEKMGRGYFEAYCELVTGTREAAA